MSAFLKAALSLITLGGASVGGYILANNYNDDAPIYGTTQAKSSLFHTRETFREGSIGNKFPFLFLSTRAVNNDKVWEAKKKKIKSSWEQDSFFTGITKDDDNVVAKIKASCMNAYKEIPKNSSGTDFLITEARWKEVWIMCGRLTTPS